MQNNALMYGIIGGLIGVIAGVYLTSSVANNNITSMMQIMGLRGYNAQFGSMMGANIDRHFIEQMVPHHEDAIAMARLAREKAKKTEIKALAEAIIQAQSSEIEEMKSWYKTWYGREVPQETQARGVGMHMGMMGNETDLLRLANAVDFDRAFIEQMIPHHQMAVMMATMLKNSTQRNEMKRLADNIIESQSKEIDAMRTWYSDWYRPR